MADCRIFPPLVELGDYLEIIGKTEINSRVVEIQVWKDTIHYFRFENGTEFNAGRHSLCHLNFSKSGK